jgi:SAM-dependent methyltransferase
MISALQAKLAAQTSTTNVLPVYIELKGSDGLSVQDLNTSTFELSPQRFDLVISHLTLHHIPRLGAILATMFGVLKEGGRIALTDFENTGPEAERFHPKSKLEGVERHGIARDEMERLIGEAGFVDVDVKEGWRMEKDVEGGESLEFPFLICLGRKPSK